MSAPPAVAISNLTRKFRVSSFKKDTLTAVDNVSLEVQAGEVYGLIGPNGSGKSTTMKVLLGLLRPTEGQCAIFGRDSARVDSREDVGFLPENPYFYKHLTGREMLRFYGRLCGLRGAALTARIKELLEMVDLTAAGDRRLAGYSKGMLQRIGLAQAIIHQPRLVVLDEPTAGVDPAGSRKIRDLILELKRRGISVILSSHLLEQVQEVCDRIGIIFRGKMVREGSLAELTKVEDQTEVLIRNAPQALLDAMRLLTGEHGAEWISAGHPRTTLERIFLEATGYTSPETKEYIKSQPR
ncbi:MAG TPA: ABC transporter ATP-binding protein [Verrucomicrobiales bacterium]|jgi:ABC-2 type transport system ATP-binding protein|nr:ABC transporter ATP-binding protein [Verrucomicrobiales bacterium]